MGNKSRRNRKKQVDKPASPNPPAASDPPAPASNPPTPTPTPRPSQPNADAPVQPSPPATVPDSTCITQAVALAASGKLDYLPQDVYKEERKLLVDLHKANADQHDKAILTLTAGLLGLTLTFISSMAPNPPHWTMYILAGGWAGLVLSIVTMLFSFLTGQWGCDHQMKLLDHHAANAERPEQTNYWSNWTKKLNVSS